MSCRDENVLLGGIYILLAATAYACMGALVKYGGKIPDELLVFTRNLICLLLLLPWILIPHPKPLKTPFFWSHLFRAMAGLLNMYCFFYSIRYILLTDAMLLNNTMPLFVPIVVWIWKKEKPPLKLWPALTLGFMGIVLILKPGLGIFQLPALAALASGVFMSISMTGIRELGKIEPVHRILFYYFLFTTMASALALDPTSLNTQYFPWIILCGVGLFAAIYQLFLTLGYRQANAAKISPLIYFAVLLSGLFDWVIWDNPPTTMSYLGSAAVIVAAIWSMRIKTA